MFSQDIWTEILSHLNLDECINLLVVCKITNIAYICKRNKIPAESIYKYRDVSRMSKWCGTTMFHLYMAGHVDLMKKMHFFRFVINNALRCGGMDNLGFVETLISCLHDIEYIDMHAFSHMCKKGFISVPHGKKWLREKLKNEHKITIIMKHGEPQFYVSNKDSEKKINYIKFFMDELTY